LCEEDKLDLALKILEKAKEKNVKIYLPLTASMAISLIMKPIQR